MPASKEQTHREFYEEFHAWFMQSRVDFWSECDAPEELATIAVELSDRFAAQRGAEAMKVVDALRRHGDDATGSLEIDQAMWAALAAFDKGAPPQTSGGDAGERARDLVSKAMRRAELRGTPHRMAAMPESVPAIDISTSNLRAIMEELARSSHREALEAPFTKALVAEARTQGYREGAEAMRKAEAVFVYDMLNLRGLDSLGLELKRHMRALPIPGKTDAG